MKWLGRGGGGSGAGGGVHWGNRKKGVGRGGGRVGRGGEGGGTRGAGGASGRVPGGFNIIVGLKPRRGFGSPAGVFPACRSLDCVSVFAMTCDDAHRVYRVVRGHDADDSYSRASSEVQARRIDPRRFRFGI